MYDKTKQLLFCGRHVRYTGVSSLLVSAATGEHPTWNPVPSSVRLSVPDAEVPFRDPNKSDPLNDQKRRLDSSCAPTHHVEACAHPNPPPSVSLSHAIMASTYIGTP